LGLESSAESAQGDSFMSGRGVAALVLVAGLTMLLSAPLGAGQGPAPVQAIPQAEAPWPEVVLTSVVAGLNLPVHITHAGDGSQRLFVVEQVGRLRIVKAGVLLDTPFLDIQSRVSCCGERGLLSVAFPAAYASVQHFYVNYTDVSGNTVVARYHLTGDPDVADPDSEQIVLTIEQPYTNHNGGQLAFGPHDGHLYIGMGDGGNAGDPEERAQNPSELLGKLLRIEVEAGDPLTYTIPATNPYTQTVGYRDEIWALGLRNPWRFSFDRRTGDLYLGDVGQSLYEEVDYQPASSPGGENYGWDIMEGFHCFEPPDCNPSGLTLPVVEYQHLDGNCSVTGGMVYRGSSSFLLQGVYLYADYCSPAFAFPALGRMRQVPSGWRNTQPILVARSIGWIPFRRTCCPCSCAERCGLLVRSAPSFVGSACVPVSGYGSLLG
jgi:glucose/arabinose dehydrogenase